MATSEYTYPPFQTIGAATLLVWDALAGGGAGAWARLCRVADAALLCATDQATQQLSVKGLTQPIARRDRSRRYSLSFRLLENANPAVLELLFGSGAAQVKQAAQDVAASETLRLFGADFCELAHPYGILDRGLPPATGLSASAGGSGGNIPAGSYYYWVAPYVNDGGARRYGKLARSAQTSVSAGQVVALSFSAPAGYTPDGYIAAYSLGPTQSGLMQLALADGHAVSISITSHSGASSFDPAYDSGVSSVKNYAGTETYTAGLDYEFDVLRGLVKRLPGGAIADGARVVVSYSYTRPASVATPLGDAVELERYRRVKLLQLSPESSAPEGYLSPALWRETGVEYEFARVATGVGDLRLPFSEDDFSEGASVSWDCLYDGATGAVGSVRSSFGVLAEY